MGGGKIPKWKENVLKWGKKAHKMGWGNPKIVGKVFIMGWGSPWWENAPKY